MNPEMQQQVDEHIKRVVAQVHDSYAGITSDLARSLAETRLDVVALSQQNGMLTKQAEATSKQLKETLDKLSEAENELKALRPDGDSN